jgi:hypothetical protein
MIIELFGSQGVGETTSARALNAELQARGRLAEAESSSRPIERLPILDLRCEPPPGPPRPLTQPITEATPT